MGVYIEILGLIVEGRGYRKNPSEDLSFKGGHGEGDVTDKGEFLVQDISF